MTKFKTGETVEIVEISLQQYGLQVGMTGTVVGETNYGIAKIVVPGVSSQNCWLGRDRADGHWSLHDSCLALAKTGPFDLATRWIYRGLLTSRDGETGTVTRVPVNEMVLFRFDRDNREVVIAIKNLFPEGEDTMKNIKTTVLAAVKALFAVNVGDSPKEQAVRQLGVAAELVRLGEADKKKAKTALTTLGIITGGEQTGVVFDSARYVMTATTKAASSRLDAAALTRALDNEGLSGAAQRRIVAAATVVNKAATSFAVETK